MRQITIAINSAIALTLASCDRTPPPPASPAPPSFAVTCAACHGATGAGNPTLGSPSIAGLPSWYVRDQLLNFQHDRRGASPNDVAGQQMRAIALTLGEGDIERVSGEVAALPAITPEKVGTPAQIEQGRELFARLCMECHRYNGSGDQFFRSATLTGLPAWYLKKQLFDYREGRRGADPADIPGQKMVKVAGWLSDEKIEAVAAYLTHLAHGDDPRTAVER